MSQLRAVSAETIARNVAALQREQAPEIVKHLDRGSILAGYSIAVADVITCADSDEDFAKRLGEESLKQLAWLQLELAEQTQAALGGYPAPNEWSRQR